MPVYVQQCLLSGYWYLLDEREYIVGPAFNSMVEALFGMNANQMGLQLRLNRERIDRWNAFLEKKAV